MALYSIKDQVVKNLLEIIGNADIKGRQSMAVVEIFQSLSAPINPGVAHAPKDKKEPEDQKE